MRPPSQTGSACEVHIHLTLSALVINCKIVLSLYRTAKYFNRIMPSTKPTHKAPPVTSVPPISPRADDNQGYRRGRAIRSCLECRRRKMRCNRSRPCQNCNRFCRDCVYHPFPEWPSGAPNTSMEESNVRSQGQGGGRAFPSFDTTQNFGYVQPSPFSNHDYNYTPDTLAKIHKHYEADGDDDALDVALQIGRLSITEKLGSYFRPHIASQVSLCPILMLLLCALYFQHQDYWASTHKPALTKESADCYTSFSDKSCRGPIQPPASLWHTAPDPSSGTVYFCSGQENSTA